jgi:hypothetical protein
MTPPRKVTPRRERKRMPQVDSFFWRKVQAAVKKPIL